MTLVKAVKCKSFCRKPWSQYLTWLKRLYSVTQHAQEITIFFRIRASGIDCPIVSIGSTPTCSVAKNDLGAVTEIHPGNYIFYGRAKLIFLC